MITHAPEADCKWRTKHYHFVIINVTLFLLSQDFNKEEAHIHVI